MAIAAAESTSLVAFKLPGTPYSVQMARFYVRATLGSPRPGRLRRGRRDGYIRACQQRGDARRRGAFDLELLRLEETGAVVVVVTDPCPKPPVKRDPAEDAEHGRGLLVIDALSARWGWTSRDPGKAVFAIFTREG